MADMKELHSSLINMCTDLFASVGVPFESTTELQRQVLASFAFGMTFAVGQIEHLTPPQVHALSIAMLVDTFKYSAEQAGAFSSHLMESGSGDGNPTIQAIIHRGIDGSLGSRRLTEITGNDRGAVAAGDGGDAVGNFIEPGPITRGKAYPDAFPRQLLRDRGANATAATGHQRRLATQVQIHAASLPEISRPARRPPG